MNRLEFKSVPRNHIDLEVLDYSAQIKCLFCDSVLHI